MGVSQKMSEYFVAFYNFLHPIVKGGEKACPLL